MKSTDLSKRLKELIDASTNEDVLAAVEAALEPRKAPPPVGVLLLVESGGRSFSTMIGQRFTRLELIALQAACRNFAASLDGSIQAMIEKETEARVKAALEAEGG